MPTLQLKRKALEVLNHAFARKATMPFLASELYPGHKDGGRRRELERLRVLGLLERCPARDSLWGYRVTGEGVAHLEAVRRGERGDGHE